MSHKKERVVYSHLLLSALFIPWGAKKVGVNFTGLMQPLGVITIAVFKHGRMFNNPFCMSAYSIFMTHAVVDRRTYEFRYALSL